ncbi:MAG: hypothetical protein IJV07_03800 [Alphaproteobacteria bacterium]|nr:hypothetical protein [Alphaproteobacteria bacterium]
MSEQENVMSKQNIMRRRLSALTPQTKLLFFACRHGYVGLAKKALKFGANVNALQKIATEYDGVRGDYEAVITVYGTPMMLAINCRDAQKSVQKQEDYRKIVELLLGLKSLDKQTICFTKTKYYENDGTSHRGYQTYSLTDVIKSNFNEKFGNSYISFWERTNEDILSLLSQKTDVLRYDTKKQTYTVFGALGHKEEEGLLVWKTYENRLVMQPVNYYYENGSLKEKHWYHSGHQIGFYEPTGSMYERVWYRSGKGISDDENSIVTERLNRKTGYYARTIQYTGPVRMAVCAQLTRIKESAPACAERRQLMRKIVAEYRAQNSRVG